MRNISEQLTGSCGIIVPFLSEAYIWILKNPAQLENVTDDDILKGVVFE